MIRPNRRMFALGAMATLAGCASNTQQPSSAPVPIGEFKLGHVIVVARHAQKVEPSRNVSQDEWDDAVTRAVEQRFRPFDGSQLYHIAVNILGYSVAVPGIPVLLAPKSVVMMDVTIWDNAKSVGADPTQGKINTEPKRLTIYESASADFVIGSGLTKSADEQVANMAFNAASQIEKWMRDHPDWFAARQ
jgi:hypothetical protein